MRRIYQAQILLLARIAFAAISSTRNQSCELNIPQSVQEQAEPLQEKLLINVEFTILGIRDVPLSGGSITIELK